MCYKGIYNTLIRAKHEKTDNSRLIEKFEKLNTIAKNMREQGDDENYIKQLVSLNLFSIVYFLLILIYIIK